MPTLFDPIRLGGLDLPNRIIMAPLTRMRSGTSRVPNAMMIEYYRQRASAGLIIAEATSVEPRGVGHAETPAIWSDEQTEGWKAVTKAVHDAGGRIILQLWHVGRLSHPHYLNGELPIAPSAIAPNGHVSSSRPKLPYGVPRALETHEIAGVIEAFRQGAVNAMRAGFDGVELHGANGYILDQFLQDISNTRTDQYGGSVENRARLMLEATDAVISVWGAERVGLHLAPRCDIATMGDSNPRAIFTHVAREAGKRGLGFIFAREHVGEGMLGPEIKKAFGGNFIANEKYTQTMAEDALASGEADAVAFGKAFISNPDLPHRFKHGLPLGEADADTFYFGGEKGYIDYPALETA